MWSKKSILVGLLKILSFGSKSPNTNFFNVLSRLTTLEKWLFYLSNHQSMIIIFVHSKLISKSVFTKWYLDEQSLWVLRRESLASFKNWFLRIYLAFDAYYFFHDIDVCVLLEKTPLVKFIRDPSGFFFHILTSEDIADVISLFFQFCLRKQSVCLSME